MVAHLLVCVIFKRIYWFVARFSTKGEVIRKVYALVALEFDDLFTNKDLKRCVFMQVNFLQSTEFSDRILAFSNKHKKLSSHSLQSRSPLQNAPKIVSFSVNVTGRPTEETSLTLNCLFFGIGDLLRLPYGSTQRGPTSKGIILDHAARAFVG